MAGKTEKKKISMTTQILIATIGGVVFGSLAGPWAANLKFIGDIFMRLIQMSVVILVMTSVASSVGLQAGKHLGRMGFNTFKWFIITTIFAGLLGYVLCLIIQPGVGIVIAEPTELTEAAEAQGLQETLVAFFSDNIISSMASGSMIPCIIFALFFGAGCSAYTASSGDGVLVRCLKAVNGAVLHIIQIVMKIAPIGVFCLLANVAGAIGFAVIIPMIKFLAFLALGDFIMFAVYIPAAAIRCGVNPLLMPKKFMKMSMIAITTTSSAISLPTEMEDCVTKFGVSRRVTDFVAPLAMTMNGNGAALYNVGCILFMSQACNVELNAVQIITGIVLACMLCMGTITVPGGAAVSLTFLATSIGIPVDAIALLLGIDWFAGMFRTLLNVDGDVIVAMLVANVEGELDRDVYNEKKTVEYTA